MSIDRDLKKMVSEIAPQNELKSILAAHQAVISDSLRSPIASFAKQMAEQNARHKELMEQMLGPSRVLQEAANQLSDFLAPHRDAIIQMQNSFQQSLKPYIEISEQIHKSFASQLGNVAKAFAQDEKERQLIANQHQELKAFLPPYFWSFAYPDIKALFLEHQKDGPMFVYHLVFKDFKHQRELIKRWTENEYYRPRLAIIKKALKAYRNGDFELVVPVLLCQIEGIIRDYFDTDNHNTVKSKIKSLFPESTEEKSSFDLLSGENLIVEIMCENIFFDFSPKRNPNKRDFHYPHRHTILHGDLTDYYSTHEHSTKCIMVLDFLSSKEFLDKVFPSSELQSLND